MMFEFNARLIIVEGAKFKINLFKAVFVTSLAVHNKPIKKLPKLLIQP